jgi:hypothetical protein
MTSKWGPLGWATLHSIALLYPDSPTGLEIDLIKRWITSFNDCIVCPSCMEHFRAMRTKYEREHPDMFSSRRALCTFVMRAHNTVNRRTKKKVYTLEESIEELTRILPNAQQKRVEYILYIRRQWALDRGLSGITALGKLRDLQLTEQQYWTSRGQPDWSLLSSLVDTVEPLQENLPTDILVRRPVVASNIQMPTFSLFKHTRAALRAAAAPSSLRS